MIVQWTISTHFHSNVCNHRTVYLVANEREFNMNLPSTSPHAFDLNSTLSTSWWDCSFMHSLQIIKTITNVQTIHHILPIYVIIIIGKKANTLHLDLHYKKIFINALMAIEFSTTCSYIVCISIHENFFNFPLSTKNGQYPSPHLCPKSNTLFVDIMQDIQWWTPRLCHKCTLMLSNLLA